jgi:pimeloyl-ACP methyl ester carboxylesterase
LISTKTIDLSQGTIRYRDLGEGNPLVFVHGFLVDGRLWSGVAERLAQQGGFRCLVPDWPMGSHTIALQPGTDLSPPGVASLIVSFLDALGLDRVTLVGNDSGGAMSQVTTATYPERIERLVLTNCDTFEHFPPVPFNALPRLARLPGGMTALAAPFRIGPVARIAYRPFTVDPLPAELISSWLSPVLGDAGIRRDTKKLTVGMNKRHTLAAAEKLRGFERPVRFVWGTEDRFFKLSHAQRLAAMVPDAEIVEIPDARTFAPLDRPEAVADAIASFAVAPSGAPN